MGDVTPKVYVEVNVAVLGFGVVGAALLRLDPGQPPLGREAANTRRRVATAPPPNKSLQATQGLRYFQVQQHSRSSVPAGCFCVGPARLNSGSLGG